MGKRKYSSKFAQLPTLGQCWVCIHVFSCGRKTLRGFSTSTFRTSEASLQVHPDISGYCQNIVLGLIFRSLLPGPKQDKQKISCEIMIRFILWIGAIIKPVYLLLTIIRPELPAFPSSLHSTLTIPLRAAWVLPMMYLIYTAWSGMLFFGSYLLTYIYSILDALDDLK